MARSSFIYIVCHNAPQRTEPPHVIAAFTVKHEMFSWYDDCEDLYRDEYVIYRLSDNDRRDGQIVTVNMVNRDKRQT